MTAIMTAGSGISGGRFYFFFYIISLDFLSSFYRLIISVNIAGLMTFKR
jgi:hypothetical protein